jgi:hypothetical protein
MSGNTRFARAGRSSNNDDLLLDIYGHLQDKTAKLGAT